MKITGYFDGLELVEPGVVLVADWRPDPGVSRGPDVPQVGAVGRYQARSSLKQCRLTA